MRARLLRLIRGGGAPLILAQMINFGVVAIPIVAGRGVQVAALVLTSAIAGIAVHTLSLGLMSVYPGLRSVDERLSLVSLALGANGALAVLLIAVALPLGAAGGLGALLFALASLVAAQTLYVICSAVLIARGDIRRFSRVRIVYAVSNLLTTGAAIALPEWTYALVYAAAASLGVAALVGIGAEARVAVGRIWRPAYSAWWMVARYWRAGLSSLIGGAAAQASALAVGLLGPFAPLWAVVVRVTSGFATVSQQVIAPTFDIRYSRSLREDDRHQAKRVATLSVLAGAAVSATAAIASWFAVDVSGVAVPSDQTILVVGVVAFFALGFLLPSVASKFLIMRGSQGLHLAWVATKLALIIPFIVSLRGLDLLVALAGVEAAGGLSYVVLLLVVKHRR